MADTDVEGKRTIRDLEAGPRRSVWIPRHALRLSTFANIKSSLHTFDSAG